MLYAIVIPVFLIVLVGYLLGRGYKKLDVEPAVFLLVYITGPALIFTSLVESEILLEEFFRVTLATCIILAVAAGIVFLIFKLFRVEHKGLYLPMTIGNTGYLGYPISLGAYGAFGLGIAIIYASIESLFLYSWGIFVAHEKNEFKEIFRVPLIYALVSGLVFSVITFQIPEIVFKPLQMIGGITIPLALIVLGYKLATIKVSHLRIALLASVFKILFMFGIGLWVIFLLGIKGVSAAVILLQAAMPSAVMTMVLCQKYKRDPEIVTSVVLLSTMISVVTIPVVLAVSKWMFGV